MTGAGLSRKRMRYHRRGRGATVGLFALVVSTVWMTASLLLLMGHVASLGGVAAAVMDGIATESTMQLQPFYQDTSVTLGRCDYDCCITFLDTVFPSQHHVDEYDDDVRQLRGSKSVRVLQGATTTNNNDNTASSSSSSNPCPVQNNTTTDTSGSQKEGGIPPGVQYFLIVILLIFSALFSGLTLGLMSLDLSGLEIVMANADDPGLARAAKAIYPVRKNGNLLLCTLLLGNVGVNSLLSILMADLTSGLVGFLASTFSIVILGEIIPQAVCSRFPLQVGEKTVPLVRVFILLLCVIAYPMAFILNKIMGHEIGTTYSASEMAKLIEMHVQTGHFQSDTGAAMTGALRIHSISVKEAMTPLMNTFMLSADEKLGFDTVAKIFKTGYSRIPVYEVSKSNVIGLLFVKDLIFLDPEDEIPVKNFVQIFGRGLHIVWPDDKLGSVLKLLKKGRSHMALVRDVNDGGGMMDPYYEIKGIITLEDIIEIILGDEIVDETDALVEVNDPDSVVQISPIGDYIEGALERSATEDDAAHHRTGSDKFSVRGIDWEARLRLLDERLVDEHLSSDEVRAVSAHLKTNYSKAVELISDKQLKDLLASVPVTEITPALTCASPESDAEDDWVPTDSTELLYERGVPAHFCTVVLTGKITVMSGADKFRSEVSNWGVLATRALTDPSYVPDFTAWVVPNPNGAGGCRIVKLDRNAYCGAVDNTALEKTGHQLGGEALRPIIEVRPPTTSQLSESQSGDNRDSAIKSVASSDSAVPIKESGDEKSVHFSSAHMSASMATSQIPVDTAPTTYVQTTVQQKVHSRRSKLLKAFTRATSKPDSDDGKS